MIHQVVGLQKEIEGVTESKHWTMQQFAQLEWHWEIGKTLANLMSTQEETKQAN